MVFKYFSHSLGYLFTLLTIYFTVSLMYSHLYSFVFVASAFDVRSKKKISAKTNVMKRISLMFSFMIFIVSGLIFKFLIYSSSFCI
jgi:hypothetical protein